MATKVPGENSFERNFGHCIVVWKIKNFTLVFCNPGTRLETQEFAITSSKITYWQIGIQFASDNDKLQIFLKRLDRSVEDFKVCWKVTILNPKGENVRLPEYRYYFERNSVHLVDLVSSLDVVKMIEANEPDKLKLEIQIIVFMNTVMIIPTPDDKGLRKLVEDMAVVFRQSLHSDMAVLINGKSLKAHRAILYPRSEKFITCSTTHGRNTLKFFFDDTATVNSIIAYLYTGDLVYILDPPSTLLYECIVNLDIKELRDSYPRQKYTMETVIEAEKFEFHWVINDFNGIDEPRDSDIYQAGTMDFSWKLRIHPKGLHEGSKMEKKYVCIEASAVSCDGTRDVYVDFKSVDREGKYLISKRTHGKIIADRKLLVLFSRIGGNSIAKSTVGNVLNLSFSFHVATGNKSTEITSSHPPVTFNLTNFDTYRLLITYLGVLQTSNMYSDITLLVQNHVVKSHKFLLAGRSMYFSRLLEKINDDHSSLNVNNAERHVLRVFLDFLYTASMTDISVPMLTQLYDLSNQFDIKILKEACETFLTEQVRPENSLQLLLFSDERHLSSLKTEALRVISAARLFITQSDAWAALQFQNPDLFLDVWHFLRNNPIGHS